MSYPDPTTPSTIPVDIGTPIQQTHDAVTTLPLTGGDIIALAVIGGLLILAGVVALCYAVATRRIDHDIDA